LGHRVLCSHGLRRSCRRCGLPPLLLSLTTEHLTPSLSPPVTRRLFARPLLPAHQACLASKRGRKSDGRYPRRARRAPRLRSSPAYAVCHGICLRICRANRSGLRSSRYPSCGVIGTPSIYALAIARAQRSLPLVAQVAAAIAEQPARKMPRIFRVRLRSVRGGPARRLALLQQPP
jgi:hypothetical protein